MRIVLKGGIYHIIQQGNNLEPLFAEDRDRLYFLHLLKECGKKFNLDIFAFCLMNNHIHLLIKLLGNNLSKGMHWLFMGYAKKFVTRHQRRGHLFAARFKSILCLSDTYFLQLSRYIHLNPVKAGIVKNPFLYRWSSCNLFVKPNIKKKSFVNVDFTLSLFSENKSNAEKLYKKFIIEGIKKKDGFKYPSLIVEGIMGRVDDLAKFKDKLPHSKDLLEFINLERNKGKTCVNCLERRRKTKVATRDYLIYQKKKEGATFKDIAKEMKISLRTAMRAIARVRVLS